MVQCIHDIRCQGAEVRVPSVAEHHGAELELEWLAETQAQRCSTLGQAVGRAHSASHIKRPGGYQLCSSSIHTRWHESALKFVLSKEVAGSAATSSFLLAWTEASLQISRFNRNRPLLSDGEFWYVNLGTFE
jgi:hypothetical protein